MWQSIRAWSGPADPPRREGIEGRLNRVVVKADAPDAPGVLVAMNQYLTDFDPARATPYHTSELVSAMKAKYPRYAVPQLLEYSAKAVYQNSGA